MSNQDEDNNVQICPDNHRCENGSLCVESPLAEGKYYCDCEASNVSGGSIFSGLYCQHEATVYCTMTGKLSKTSFCTNLGTCRGTIDETGGEHMGCDCPQGYTGEHCQFIEGSEVAIESVADNTLASAISDETFQRGGDGTGMGTLGVLTILFVSLFILSSVLVLLLKRRAHSMAHTNETSKSSDGNLHEADGARLSVPSDTFESEEGPRIDINRVDSGHLA